MSGTAALSCHASAATSQVKVQKWPKMNFHRGLEGGESAKTAKNALSLGGDQTTVTSTLGPISPECPGAPQSATGAESLQAAEPPDHPPPSDILSVECNLTSPF